MIEAQNPSLISLIIGSAAVGALVSSVITLIGQHLERRARQRELLLSKAIELSELHTDLLKAVAERGNRSVNMYPHIVQTRWFLNQLQSLLFKGKLSSNMEDKYGTYFNSPNAESKSDD